MSRPPTPGEQGIIEIIDATEELARQWQAGNSAAILVEFAEGVGVQVRRALPQAPIAQSSGRWHSHRREQAFELESDHL